MTLQALNALDLSQIGDWPKTVQRLLILLICAGILTAAYWLLLQDQHQHLQHLTNKEQLLREEFAQQQRKAANLPLYQAQLRDIQNHFGIMLRQLPDQTEVADLLVDVSQTGLAVGLEFVLFQPQAEKTETFYAELPIKLRVLGRYHQFGEFVSGLATLPRIVTLHDIRIKSQTANAAGNPLLIMEATAKTYRYLPLAKDT